MSCNDRESNKVQLLEKQKCCSHLFNQSTVNFFLRINSLSYFHETLSYDTILSFLLLQFGRQMTKVTIKVKERQITS